MYCEYCEPVLVHCSVWLTACLFDTAVGNHVATQPCVSAVCVHAAAAAEQWCHALPSMHSAQGHTLSLLMSLLL